MLEFVATAAPGVKEILTVGKVCWEVRESIEGRAAWDLVIVDAAASGHVLAQLDSPRAIRELVQVGPVRQQTEWMVELLSDPAITAVDVVTAPEEMPVNETIELVARAREEIDVPLGSVIVNRVLPEPFTRADEPVFEALGTLDAEARLVRAAGAGVPDVLAATRLAVALRRSRAVHLARLRDEVDLPIIYLPYLFVRDHGLRVTRMVADALGAELGA
jgi:anion-transporting  ArsA/GET3 family ATPase